MSDSILFFESESHIGTVCVQSDCVGVAAVVVGVDSTADASIVCVRVIVSVIVLICSRTLVDEMVSEWPSWTRVTTNVRVRNLVVGRVTTSSIVETIGAGVGDFGARRRRMITIFRLGAAFGAGIAAGVVDGNCGSARRRRVRRIGTTMRRRVGFICGVSTFSFIISLG